ncbi:hypothetical protein MXB_2577, partial [Myxobolus squamalis]
MTTQNLLQYCDSVSKELNEIIYGGVVQLPCSLDSTCVMCEDCFLSSKHITHPYMMLPCSVEGGCCDCGDEEAWTSEAVCAIHYSSEEEKILSVEFKSRIIAIFIFLIDYLMKIGSSPIHWKASSYLESTSVTEDPSRHRFCVVVLNDESHSPGIHNFMYEPVKAPLKTMVVSAELMYHMYLSAEI